MEKRTIRIPDDVATEIDRRAEADDVSESAAARQLLHRGMDADELESERDELRNQLQAVNQREDNVGELVEYVERERELQQRERERRDAPLWRRARWFVLGRE